MQKHMEYCISNILRLIAHIFLAYNHASSHISGQNVWFWLLGLLIICWSGENHHHPLARLASWLEEPSQKYIDTTIGIKECGLSVVSWQLVESYSQGIAWWLEVAPLAVVMGCSPSSWYVCPMPGWTNPDLDPTSECMTTLPLPDPSRSSMSKKRLD